MSVAALGADGDIIFGRNDGTLLQFNPASGLGTTTITTDLDARITAIGISADGRLAVAGTDGGSLAPVDMVGRHAIGDAIRTGSTRIVSAFVKQQRLARAHRRRIWSDLAWPISPDAISHTAVIAEVLVGDSITDLCAMPLSVAVLDVNTRPTQSWSCQKTEARCLPSGPWSPNATSTERGVGSRTHGELGSGRLPVTNRTSM